LVLKRMFRAFGVLLGVLCLVMPFGGTASATSVSFTASSLPWSSGPVNICIGGERCGLNDTVTVNVPSQSYIRYVQVNANDNVGNVHDATLQVYVDGTLRGSQDVKQAGSTLIFTIQGLGTQIVFRSIRSGNSMGDETVLTDIQVLNS
jgi:hypothetical protein